MKEKPTAQPWALSVTWFYISQLRIRRGHATARRVGSIHITRVLERELLTADRCFEHQPAARLGEDGDAVLVSRRGGGAGFERDGRRVGGEREVVAAESAQRIGVLKRDQFAVGLPAELQADRALTEIAVSDHSALLVDNAATIRSAHAYAAFPDGGEDHVAVGLVDEALQARIGVGHRVQRRLRLIAQARPLLGRFGRCLTAE